MGKRSYTKIEIPEPEIVATRKPPTAPEAYDAKELGVRKARKPDTEKQAESVRAGEMSFLMHTDAAYGQGIAGVRGK